MVSQINNEIRYLNSYRKISPILDVHYARNAYFREGPNVKAFRLLDIPVKLLLTSFYVNDKTQLFHN